MGRVRGTAGGRRDAVGGRRAHSPFGGSDRDPEVQNIEKNRVHSGRHPPAASHMQWGALRGNTHSARGVQSCHGGLMRHSKVMAKRGVVGTSKRERERKSGPQEQERGHAGRRQRASCVQVT